MLQTSPLIGWGEDPKIHRALGGRNLSLLHVPTTHTVRAYWGEGCQCPRNGLWEPGKAQEELRTAEASCRASHYSTDIITKEMGSSEVAIATPGSGCGLAKAGWKGKGKSGAQKRPVNANQIQLGPPTLRLLWPCSSAHPSPHHPPPQKTTAPLLPFLAPPCYLPPHPLSDPSHLPQSHPPIPRCPATPSSTVVLPPGSASPQISKNGSSAHCTPPRLIAHS